MKDGLIMKRKVKVKVHKKPKTKRIYDNVGDVLELCEVMKKHGDKKLFSYFDKNHKLSDITYKEFENMINAAAAEINALGLAGAKIAIIGETSPEWHCMYLATLASGGVAIPMDRELAVNEISGFLDWVKADAIAYSESFHDKFKSLRENHSSLKTFIPFTGEYDGDEKIVSFKNLIDAGRVEIENGYEYPRPVDREKMAEMLFTSGTTGSSKCVMLSQKNIFSVVMSAAETVDFGPEDVVVSVLPVHHTYELAINLTEMVYGINICINDSLSHTLKNFKLFKPTGLILVPLFVYTMHKKIWSEARRSGKENKLKVGIIAAGTMKAAGVDFRRKIFAEVLDAFGGRLEKIICGGAPLDPLMIEAFENFGVSIYEGYGITECSPLASVTPYYARKYGSVGPTVPCCNARIDATGVNDFGYEEGEIQIKGDNVMLGYYDNDEANAEVFTDDGWFCTGDVGYMDDDGYIFITGRKKSVIVLENGKNVFPEEIEEYLSHIEKISECVVIGRGGAGEKIDLTAVIYPNYDEFAEDVDDDTVQRALEHEITVLNRKLPSFKRIMRIEIRHSEFEKTTSKKIKRHLVK